MDRGGWWATVHRVAKSCTWLIRLSTHALMDIEFFLFFSIINNLLWICLCKSLVHISIHFCWFIPRGGSARSQDVCQFSFSGRTKQFSKWLLSSHSPQQCVRFPDAPQTLHLCFLSPFHFSRSYWDVVTSHRPFKNYFWLLWVFVAACRLLSSCGEWGLL